MRFLLVLALSSVGSFALANSNCVDLNGSYTSAIGDAIMGFDVVQNGCDDISIKNYVVRQGSSVVIQPSAPIGGQLDGIFRNISQNPTEIKQEAWTATSSEVLREVITFVKEAQVSTVRTTSRLDQDTNVILRSLTYDRYGDLVEDSGEFLLVRKP